MEFLPDISKLIQLFLKIGHIFFAILWVGTSYTFIYLDNKLPKNTKEEGIIGSSTLLHSGFLYKLIKFQGAPKEVPKNVIVWKYTSYATLLSGLALLIMVYYMNADILMVDKRVNPNISSFTAILISILSIIGSWIIYDFISKSKLTNYKIIFPAVLLIIFTAIAFSLTKIYGSRFAFLQMGIITGTIMSLNVFFIIAKNSIMISLAVANKTKFDLNLSVQAKQRSVFNNIITLPTLFIMVTAAHGSYIWSSSQSWLILGLLTAILGLIQHFINLRNQKNSN